MKKVWFANLLLVAFMVMITACSGGSTNGTANSDTSSSETIVTINSNDYVSASLSATSVGMSGGTISVSDLESPLYGFSIEIPSGATSEDITFSVSYADISSIAGLPEGVVYSTQLIKIETSGSDDWNTARMFDLPVQVTLPYYYEMTPFRPGLGESEYSLRYYVYNSDGSLEPTGFGGIDRTGDTVTFYTRSFANTSGPSRLTPQLKSALNTRDNSAADAVFSRFVALGLSPEKLAEWKSKDTTVDTGFLPSKNGWFIPNKGSYYDETQGGSCGGFVDIAKYYYRKNYAPILYENYRDDKKTPTWMDDDVAIQFTARVQHQMMRIWDQYNNSELYSNVQSNEEDVALSFIGAMYVTKVPAIISVNETVLGLTIAAHVTLAYRADRTSAGDITFHVYDPNKPGDDTKRIIYKEETGFEDYIGSTSAGDIAFNFNKFRHMGYYMGVTDAFLQRMKEAADKKFDDDTVFPKMTITEVKGVDGGTEKEGATESETAGPEGRHAYVTDYRAVKISGTVLGGLAQAPCCVVNNLIAIANGMNEQQVNVNNVAGGGDGTFSVTIPLPRTYNSIAFLAGKDRLVNIEWAAYKADWVVSYAMPTKMNITLNWDNNNSDLDLFVTEPDSVDGTKKGDTVYWKHSRQGAAPVDPFLSLDNRIGFGPEDYTGTGSATLYTNSTHAEDAYGIYKVRVHYYHDRNGCDSVTPVKYTVGWRYLAFCAPPCTDAEKTGKWIKGSKTGVLSQDGPRNGRIDSYGSDWSDYITIDYKKPNADDWKTP